MRLLRVVEDPSHLPTLGFWARTNAPDANPRQLAGSGASPADRLKLGYNAAARLAAGSVAAFVTTAGFLRSHGLSAHEINAHDLDALLAVLEDLRDGL